MRVSVMLPLSLFLKSLHPLTCLYLPLPLFIIIVCLFTPCQNAAHPFAMATMAAMALVSFVSPTDAANPLAKLLLFYITAAIADNDLLAC